MEKTNKINANNLTPFYPTHPGEVIKDEIEYRGISQRQLAKEIGVSSSLLNEVLNGKRPMNTQLALLISVALDIDAEPLIRLQSMYEVNMAKRNRKFMKHLSKVRKIAAIL